MSNHYFFALALPDQVKQELASLCTQLQDPFPFKKWVHQADYHITLAFLGAVEQDNLIEAMQCMEENLYKHRAFSLRIDHLDTFGKRIFWAGVEKSEALLDLQQMVFTCCEMAGFELEKRSFHPHITLARKWDGEQWMKKEQLRPYYPSLSFLADEVVLYQTDPHQTPKYKKRKTFRLAH
ncbi:RNA 2',3'-cyclic phosphodiesterase [Lederbergia sp. NSJ-179]|uniref:RNA 2',3'-cyclic phosphodiesterase n=1 Tax=Lederbergia sp. NSJ-179 TaxID=2931402 RepID=UPI001FD4D43A|nr:RNA 2',3'-cyclic phosphodiesterase [Lederbergia sp. NSJ-179]MCJ7842768.1 RNA 2',3'-cyclic phosphodiesterase [Lederbergia sp. NSJ-179]